MKVNESSNFHPKTIVCIDDDSRILEVFEGYLEEDFNVVTFTSPSEAHQYLKYFSCDLIILDVFMPEMTGFEFMEMIAPSRLGKIPILICSGGGESGPFVGGIALDTGIEIGAKDGLLKPFGQEELRRKVKSLLARYQVDFIAA